MSQFSTNSAVSLEKEVDLSGGAVETPPECIENAYEVTRCAQWIKSNSFHKVCLQFPDGLLPDSVIVALRLQKALEGEPVFILGDTSCESCCIDYVAAAHVNADAIIHFGPVCFSQNLGKIPNLNIYEKAPLDVSHFRQCFLEKFGEKPNKNVIVLLDSSYLHHQDSIVSHFPEVRVESVENSEDLSGFLVIFVSDNSRKLLNLQFNRNTRFAAIYCYNAKIPLLFEHSKDEKVLRRRCFLVEKIKDSNTVGIVIGTVAVKNYLEVIKRVKELVTLHGKKYYVISVGKPTVAKLANFPEIDIYVVITCSMNEIYDSRDFYRPIVTPYDVEIALNPKSNGLPFTYDFSDFVSNPIGGDIGDGNDVSLITGNVRQKPDEDVEMDETGDGRLALKNDGTLALNSNFGAGYLAERSWKGLEQKLGESEVTTVQEGRRGIAQGYAEEGAGNS